MAEWAKSLFHGVRRGARYSMETKSREASVTYFPARRSGRSSLPTIVSTVRPLGGRFGCFPTDRLKLRIGRQFISWGETDGFRCSMSLIRKT